MSDSDATFFEHEYQALRAGRAAVELVGWSSISVTGADRQAFLHNFCTNDIKRLTPGTGCEAFFTNAKGRIVGHGLIYCRENEFQFIGAPVQAARIVDHLNRYVIREDVVLRDTTDERHYLLVAGDMQRTNSHQAIAWNFLCREDTRLEEYTPDGVSAGLRAYDEKGFTVAGSWAFAAARIEAGMPLYEIDFDERNLPQEIGRDRQAISFNKGCYLGQETVARIDALGHVNQRLVGVRFFGSELPERGTEISRGGTPVGRMTSAVFSPQLGAPLALAMLRREASSPGARLESSNGECEVIGLPLCQRG